MKIWEPEIEQWIEDNRILIDSGDYTSIIGKFDKDVYDNNFICSFESQDRFNAILACLKELQFKIKPEFGCEIDLYVVLSNKEELTVYQITWLSEKEYSGLLSLSDENLINRVLLSFKKDRDIPQQILSMVKKNLILDRRED